MRPLDVLLCLCLVLQAAPARADDEDDLLRAASWCATAARVVRGWQDRSLPLPYTRRTLALAADQLRALDEAFARRDAAARGRLVGAIDAVRDARNAVERHDTGSVPRRIAELERQSRSLASNR